MRENPVEAFEFDSERHRRPDELSVADYVQLANALRAGGDGDD